MIVLVMPDSLMEILDYLTDEDEAHIKLIHDVITNPKAIPGEPFNDPGHFGNTIWMVNEWVKDGFIKNTENPNVYKLTFKGLWKLHCLNNKAS
jgi:hypothetical protein